MAQGLSIASIEELGKQIVGIDNKVDKKTDEIVGHIIRLDGQIEQFGRNQERMSEEVKNVKGRMADSERKWLIYETEQATKLRMTSELKKTAWQVAGAIITAGVIGVPSTLWFLLQVVR